MASLVSCLLWARFKEARNVPDHIARHLVSVFGFRYDNPLSRSLCLTGTSPVSALVSDTVLAAPNELAPTASRKVYLETLGCQMNLSDSELMLGMLMEKGFTPTDNPKQADLLIINTCQIRDHSEHKAYSYLGRWGVLKKQRPHIKIAMAGCVAQQAKDGVFQRMPHVDIVFGTQNLQDLPTLVARAFAGETHVSAVDKQKPRSTYDYMTDVTARRESDISAWVTVIEGCDYFCTYCVVPYTRGRQISRDPDSIVREVADLARFGFKEVTLLGQTVDSYGKDFTNPDSPHHTHAGTTLATLFERLSAIDGLERIRFMTSHPLDLSDAIIDAMATLPKVMPYIHIPMQAGDTEVLERMRRGYTAEQYYALTDKLHARIPGLALTGDYIVGFPGETEAQFQRTLDSVTRANIDTANTAAYSARAQTPAGIWEQRGEQVPDDVKADRLARLNAAIEAQSSRRNATYHNQVVEVLVEGKSKRNPNRLTGRTPTNKVVNFDAHLPEEALVGHIVPVRITQPLPFSLLGEMVDPLLH